MIALVPQRLFRPNPKGSSLRTSRIERGWLPEKAEAETNGRPERRHPPWRGLDFRRTPSAIEQNPRPRAGWARRCRELLADHFGGFNASCGGAAILEFAIVLPVAIALLAGTVELGRVLYTYLSVEQAVRAGARYLARVPNPTCLPVCSWGASRAIRLAQSQIVSNTGIVSELVKVVSLAEPPSDTVVLTAEVEMSFQLFGVIGVANSWTLTVSHQEQRIGE